MSDYPYREFSFKRIISDDVTIVISRELFTEDDEQLLIQAADNHDEDLYQALMHIAMRDQSKSSTFSSIGEPATFEFVAERDIWAG